MSNVIDINTRRLGKVIEERPKPPPDAAPPEMESIPLIACGGCHSNEFQLAQDGRVICPKCAMVIAEIRWFDPTKPSGGPRGPDDAA